jgi:hypothetical protein
MSKGRNLYFVSKYKVEGVANYATVQECADYCKDKKHLGLDIETSRHPELGDNETDVYKGGLDPYLSRVLMLQIGDLERQYAIDVRDFTKEELKPIIDLLHWNKDILLVAHNCLPMDTEVLTKQGWKKYENIKADDVVYGSNEGTIEPQKINSIIDSIGEVIELYNTGRSLRSTKDHRWLCTDRYKSKEFYSSTEALLGTRNQIILNTNNHKFPIGVPISDEELKLIVWANTDGTVRWYKDNVQDLSVTQSYKNSWIIDEIKDLFNKLNLKPREDIIKTEGHENCVRFTITSTPAREILNKINFKKNYNFCEFVLQLSKHQLDIFIDTFWKAEGVKKGKTKLEKFVFAQKSKGYVNDTRDAIALALHKAGYTIGSNPNTIRAKNRLRADLRSLNKRSLGVQKVFCLNVPLSNFVVRQDDKIFLTGNCKFEGKHLRHNYDIRLMEVYDTMLAEISLYNGVTEGLSLAALAEKYLGIKKKETVLTLFDTYRKTVTLEDSRIIGQDLDNHNSFVITPFEVELTAEMDKSIRMQFIKMTDEPFTFEQLNYGVDDVIYPLLIKKEQDKGHDILGFQFHNPKNIKLESIYTQVGADMEYNGLPFSREIWQKMHDENEIKYKERLDKLNDYVIKNIPLFMTPTLFGPECIVDWKSPKSCIELFRHLDACPQEKSKSTKKLEWSVSSKAMLPTLSNDFKDYYGKDKWQEITDIESLKLAYLLLRKTQMNITTYGQEFLKYIHPLTGRVHPNYRLHLISGRTATTSPNLLAIPGSHRCAFNLHGTDRSLVVNDYSSQESRIIASKSNDVLLTEFFNKGHKIYGEDFHTYTAALVHSVRNPDSDLKLIPKEFSDGSKNPDFTSEMGKIRQDTKAVNFGLAYGITAISLSKQLGISLTEATELIDSYFETFTDLHEFLKKSQSDALKSGYVLFEPKFSAIFIQKDYEETKEKEETCKSYFFNDMYKALNTEERAKYKEELYRTKPHIKEWFTDVGIMKSRLANRGCNLRIQGTAAKQSKVAQINMRKHSINHPKLDWNICLLLHDEVVSEAPDETANEVAILQGKYMKVAAEYFCPNVKFESSGGAFKKWEH